MEELRFNDGLGNNHPEQKMLWNFNATFEMNGKNYKTDLETLNVLRSIMPGYEASKDSSALFAVMNFGLTQRRIIEI